MKREYLFYWSLFCYDTGTTLTWYSVLPSVLHMKSNSSTSVHLLWQTQTWTIWTYITYYHKCTTYKYTCYPHIGLVFTPLGPKINWNYWLLYYIRFWTCIQYWFQTIDFSLSILDLAKIFRIFAIRNCTQTCSFWVSINPLSSIVAFLFISLISLKLASPFESASTPTSWRTSRTLKQNFTKTSKWRV